MPKLTWHGHSCFILEHGGKRIIIDPFLTGNPKADVEPAKLPALDAILLTHGHGDHLGDAEPLAKRSSATPASTPCSAARCTMSAAGFGVFTANSWKNSPPGQSGA